ncbi:hypothetical protein BC937DRAFT_94725 [Endogone sp. FLAS-F59071]|nr:hypothetical protein BC937DRAFT_94725 [Endogone sp. FLAS-F59071]|eukprot:RUS22952.1 hypothetical protein BC937DRAFT_94725 [Endogone sp. FLAS-F59071]
MSAPLPAAYIPTFTVLTVSLDFFSLWIGWEAKSTIYTNFSLLRYVCFHDQLLRDCSKPLTAVTTEDPRARNYYSSPPPPQGGYYPPPPQQYPPSPQQYPPPPHHASPPPHQYASPPPQQYAPPPQQYPPPQHAQQPAKKAGGFSGLGLAGAAAAAGLAGFVAGEVLEHNKDEQRDEQRYRHHGGGGGWGFGRDYGGTTVIEERSGWFGRDTETITTDGFGDTTIVERDPGFMGFGGDTTIVETDRFGDTTVIEEDNSWF